MAQRRVQKDMFSLFADEPVEIQGGVYHLFDYQEEAIKNVIRDWDRGVARNVWEIPTGGGKTIAFLSALIRVLKGNERALILAHRDQLIFQTVEAFIHGWPELQHTIGIVKAENNDCQKRIVVATVQTLFNENRLEEVLAHGRISYVITDEVHHSFSEMYQKTYARIFEHNPEVRHLGVTATPGDVGLINAGFTNCSFKIGILDLIKRDRLVDPYPLIVQTGINLTGVPITKGDGGPDYAPRKLAEVFETANAFELIVESYQKYADGRKAIAFTVSVAGAYALAKQFNDKGIPAGVIEANTNPTERKKIIADHKAGIIRILCNCAVLTEGYDDPSVDCILMCRPTKSRILFTQMIGRGLRKYTDPVTGYVKHDCLILEFTSKQVRSLVSMGDIIGIPRNLSQMKPLAAAQALPGTIVGGMKVTKKGILGVNGDPKDLLTRQVDYLKSSQFNWDTKGDWLYLPLVIDSESSKVVAISPYSYEEPHYRMYEVGRYATHPHYFDFPVYKNTVKEIATNNSFDELQVLADKYVQKNGANANVKQRGWETDPATKQQLKLLARVAGKKAYADMTAVGMPRLTKAMAEKETTALIAQKALTKYGKL